MSDEKGDSVLSYVVPRLHGRRNEGVSPLGTATLVAE